jgi:hypothetical protein
MDVQMRQYYTLYTHVVRAKTTEFIALKRGFLNWPAINHCSNIPQDKKKLFSFSYLSLTDVLLYSYYDGTYSVVLQSINSNMCYILPSWTPILQYSTMHTTYFGLCDHLQVCIHAAWNGVKLRYILRHILRNFLLFKLYTPLPEDGRIELNM